MLMSNHMLVCAAVMRMRNHMYQKKLKKVPAAWTRKILNCQVCRVAFIYCSTTPSSIHF